MANNFFIPTDNKDYKIGESSKGQPITMIRFGNGKTNILILAGVHGDEVGGIELIQNFTDFAKKNLSLFDELNSSIFVIPIFNPDGHKANSRLNGNSIDLNRNLPTKDWDPKAANERYVPGPHPGSEPESKLMVELLDEIKPKFILSVHNYVRPLINTNGDCSEIAKIMNEANSLPIDSDIGYPTPGSLGTYAGFERGIPTITLEIEKDERPDVTWQKNKDAILGAIKHVANL